MFGTIWTSIRIIFREPIPISTNKALFVENCFIADYCQWTIIIQHSNKGFLFNGMEIYWIFGDPQNIPPVHQTNNHPMIYVFQYGNTNWSYHSPFQHKRSEQMIYHEDHLYTNEFMLDQNGNVVGVRICH